MHTPSTSWSRQQPGRRAVLSAALATPVAVVAASAAAPAARATGRTDDTRHSTTAAQAADRESPSCLADLLPDGA